MSRLQGTRFDRFRIGLLGICLVCGGCASDGAPRPRTPRDGPVADQRSSDDSRTADSAPTADGARFGWGDENTNARPTDPDAITIHDFAAMPDAPPLGAASGLDSGSRYVPVATPEGQVAVESPPIGAPTFTVTQP